MDSLCNSSACAHIAGSHQWTVRLASSDMRAHICECRVWFEVLSISRSKFSLTCLLASAADVNGLRYFDKEQGRGKAVQAGDTVVVS